MTLGSDQLLAQQCILSDEFALRPPHVGDGVACDPDGP
jgi:hypothetical protein